MFVEAVNAIAPGGYAIAVSGGADSVALLRMLHDRRGDISLHVVHLDHQTRGRESTGDAAFVAQLADQYRLKCTVMRRDQLEPVMPDLPSNKSARYRAIRLELFRRVVKDNRLNGVLLAHHADDQAETILHRLLRGSRAPYLSGMAPQTTIGGLLMLRPLLEVRRVELREYLVSVNQPWRDDASNASMDYFRNRLRRMLEHEPQLTDHLLDLHQAMAGLRGWMRQASPVLGEKFAVGELQGLPSILAAESARRWLAQRGAPRELITPDAIQQLIDMASDAAAPARQQFPGGITVRRKKGVVFLET